jgi:hypothetical protein
VPESKGNGESLSLQTLVIAAAASAAAALIVSHLWRDGTVIAAAMTPVIVAIVKELLARPMESEIVRKPVQQVGRIASSRLPVSGRASTGGTVETGRAPRDPLADEPSPTEPQGLRRDYGRGDGVAPTEAQLTPMRTYGTGRRRPIHLKIAIVTGLIAFLIAAAVLTLPELLFGGAISSKHDTTLFGGGSSKSDKKKNQDNGGTTQPTQPKPNQQLTTRATPPPTTGSKPPTKTTPAPTSPQQSPQQTTPQQTTPLPTTPSPPTP